MKCGIIQCVGLARLLIGLALMIMGVPLAVGAGTPSPTAIITLDQPLHFYASDGTDVVVGPGEYAVRPLAGSQVELRATGKEPVLLQAQSILHEKTLESVSTVVVPDAQNPDLVHLMLLQPEGQGLDVVGSISGVQTRGKAPKQLSPTYSGGGPGWVSDQLIIIYKPTVSVQGKLSLKSQMGLEKVKEFTAFKKGHEIVRIPPGTDLDQMEAQLRQMPDVELVQKNFISYPQQTTPNDQRFAELLGMTRIQAPLAWTTVRESPNVIVAVLDQGTDWNHPDLRDAMWRNPRETPNDGIDDDGNGFIDDVHGADFCNNDGDPAPTSAGENHGTHVAGTIGAVGNNGVGVAGVTWRTQIMALRFLGAGCGTTDQEVLAIDYAINNGAHIINASFGRSTACNIQNQLELGALTKARDAGILVVAAAGNGQCNGDQIGDNNEILHLYPSDYDLANIISVAATATGNLAGDALTGFSNYGPISVDLGAPGQGILSTVPGPVGYLSMNGTSMAAPHVAGAAALVKGQHPTWNATMIKQQLMRSVDPVPALNGRVVSGGRLNLARAVGSVLADPFWTFEAVFQQYGLAGYDLANSADQAVALDFNGDGRDDLFLYRPGQGIAYVLQSNGNGTFTTVQSTRGIAGFDLASTADRAVALDFNGDGRDDLFLYRPGQGIASVLRSEGNGTFTAVQTTRGIAGFDLANLADRAVALDFNGDGKDDLFIYRPGQGIAYVLQSNGNGTFTAVQMTHGIAGYDLANSADRAVALDFNGDGKDDLFLYRPGAGSQAWLLQSNGNGTFTTVQATRGIAGYDLASPADRAVALDFNGDGRDDLFLYRPGQGIASVLRSEGNGTFIAMLKENGVAGYDLANPADIAVSIDVYGDNRNEILFLRPGQGIAMLARSRILE